MPNEMRLLLLCAGLLAVGSNLGCDAHLLGKVERGPCQAKNPFGRGFLDGTCMPLVKCKRTLRGIIRLNFPVVCGVELLSPIVCCPHMGPAPPRGGGVQGPVHPAPHPQPFPPVDGGSGVPVKPEYPPAMNPRPPRGNSPGTGPVPPQPGSGGPVAPPIPDSKPGKQPLPGGGAGAGSNPPAEEGSPGAPCDKPECEPEENDSYIHLIDPRRGKN